MEISSKIITQEQIEKLTQAGNIAKQVKTFARELIKPQILLLEIAEKIEEKIAELGGKPAFPTNLSINEIAAHCTPTHNDQTKAEGLLKVDIGVQIEGYIADTAFSIDLENSDENKSLINAAEAGLAAALKTISLNVPVRKIGSAIETEIKSHKFQPIVNLSGHKIELYNLHSGLTVPNSDNFQEIQITTYSDYSTIRNVLRHTTNKEWTIHLKLTIWID